MKIANFSDIKGTEFPAGRNTRVIIGDNGAIQGSNFAQGFVAIHVGGKVPLHDHTMEESYTILSGKGEMRVGEEIRPVSKGDVVLVDPNLPHELVNTGQEELHMMFVYSPKEIADHWAQELSGEIE